MAAVSAVVMVVQLPGPHATAWHFFELAVDLLGGAGDGTEGTGLSLYADHPELQFGPLAVVAAAPFTWLGPSGGEVAVMVVGSALGLVVVKLLIDTVELLRPGALARTPVWTTFGTGALVVVTWGDVAVRTAHLDDALAWTATMVGVRAVAGARGGVATVALAVAAAVKPWAVVFAPLASVPPAAAGRPGWWRWSRPVVAGGVALATWLPFVVAEPATLDTSDFGIENDPTSVLRALGVGAATTPDWVRPVQLVGGVAAVGVLVLWRRWPAAVLAGVGWRLLFDPGAHRYYTIGVVLGGLLLELTTRPGRFPWWTLGAAVVLEATALPDAPAGPGRYLRAVVVIAGIVAAARSQPVDDRGTFGPVVDAPAPARLAP